MYEDLEEQEREKPVRQSLFIRICSLLLMLILVLGSVVLVVYHDELNLDAFRRSLAYYNIKKEQNGAAEAFPIERDPTALFRSFDGGVLTASSTGCSLFAADGTRLLSEAVYLKNPVISAGRKLAAVFDAGGTALRLVSGKAIVLTLDLPEGRTIFSARVNGEGYLALTAEESGYKAVVRVFNDRQKEVFQWKSSSRFVTDAVVSEDSKFMAAATVGQENAFFNCRIVIYRLDSQTEFSSCELGDVVPIELKFPKDDLWVVCDEKVFRIGKEGTILGDYDYDGLRLMDYSLDGDGFLTLLLGGHAGSNYRKLVMIDSDFNHTAELPIREDVFSLSAAGRYVALLFADRLDIYAGEFSPYSSLNGTESAQTAIVREDGSAILIGEGTARLYIP